MAATILADFGHQWLDDDGKPGAGFLMYFYATGTSDPVAVYSDSDKTTEWSWPIEMNSAGRLPSPGLIFCADSPSLDIYVTDSEGSPIFGPYGPVATLASV